MTQKSDSTTPVHHQSLSGTLDRDADGWYYARCACGWAFGAERPMGFTEAPLPGIEEVVDVLMEHAAEEAAK